MLKLREVKAKSEDSGSKARQYLEGLLKIPFGVYKKEPILSLMDNIKIRFEKCVNKIEKNEINIPLPGKKPYSSLEIAKFFPQIESAAINQLYNININKLVKFFTKGKRDTLVANCNFINSVGKKERLHAKKYKSVHS
jgi:hypothetical protein